MLEQQYRSTLSMRNAYAKLVGLPRPILLRCTAQQ